MNQQLTRGTIEALMSGEHVEKPVLQVLGQKKITSGQPNQGADRYRLLLSDGVYTHSSAMLATQLNDKIVNGDLNTFAVIRLDKYMCNVIPPDRRVMILLEITILAKGTEVQAKLGNPQPFKQGGASGEGEPQQNGHNGNDLGMNDSHPPSAPFQQQLHQPVAQSSFNPSGNRPPQQQQAAATSTFAGRQQPLLGGGQQQQQNQQQSSSASFYKTGASAAQQNQPRVVTASVGGQQGDTPLKVHPILSLTPYQNKWNIRARVTNKSAIKTWSNSRGEGKLFSVNLLDESGEIRATAFKEQCDKFYEMLEVNKVYFISKGTLKTADKRYSNVNNDYEMTFNNDTQITLCQDTVDLPTLTFNFVPINELEKCQNNSSVDVIGVVKSAGDVQTITAKATNKELQKRDLFVVDRNQVQVRLTLWASDAVSFDASSNPVLAVKGCRVSDFGGRSLSVLQSTQLVLNPDIPEAHQLRGWFDQVGRGLSFSDYQGGAGAGGQSGSFATVWKTLVESKGESVAVDKADYFTCKATLVHIKKENAMYMACPSADCNKKVVDQGNGMYRCEKCNATTPNFKWRLLLQGNIADFSDNQWMTAFQENAELILGKTAEEIGRMREANDGSFDQLFQEANFKPYIFKLRSKMETYNDESRLKVSCITVAPVNYREYNQKLIEDIDKMLSSR